MLKYNIIILLLIISIIIFPSKTISQFISIEDAVKMGIQNNPEIKKAELNIQKQEAIKLKSVDIPKPQIFIEYEGIKGGLKNFESRKIGIMQELEFPTSYFLKNELQNTEILKARSEKELAIAKFKHEIKSNYMRMQLNEMLLTEANANLRIYEDFLFAAEKKYDAGSTSNLEVLSAKVNRIKFENEIRTIESKIKIHKAELKRLLNTKNEISAAEEFKIIRLTLNIEDIISMALKNNPELAIVRLQKEKNSGKISLSKSELLPELSLKYYRQKIGNVSGYWGFELGIGIPLWFWWQPAGNMKEAELDYNITLNEEITVKQKIEAEIKIAYEEYFNNIRQLDFLSTDAISQANEILRQARVSYIEGSIDYVEMLQAITTSYDVKVQYLNAVFSVNSSVNDLEMLSASKIY
ncbi:MAG: TolC family protein [Ignavibacteria bacterium]|nr:TolC family protein [Ignavibacteria bacterium]